MFRGDGRAFMAVSRDVIAQTAMGSSRLKPLPQRRCATSKRLDLRCASAQRPVA
jgi:hypothetical protein